MESSSNPTAVRSLDFTVTVESGLADGEVTMQEWTMVGTHEGEFNGLTPTGRVIEMNTMSKTRIADGRIQEVREYYDSRSPMTQLGVTDDGGGANL